ncbi:sensor histidine kinase [Amycolatopsis taiwanensis]|uniref:sensor histidine kinase n=1 Tax=Amycolatopsis taiwanensis TaxID=342230 RepID=UPI002554FD07|nr:sensor histidine kinase [Amycolatopsis taiwanensis]
MDWASALRGPRSAAWRGWRRLPLPGQDTVVAALVAVASLALPMLDLAAGRPGRGLGPVWALLVLAACAPLAVRRRLPWGAWIASATVVTVGAVAGQPPAGVVAAMVAAGSAAYHCARARAALAVASTGWMVAVMLATAPAPSASAAAAAAGSGLAPVALGHALRAQRDRTELMVRLHRAQALRERAEERDRIAREVHDVVGHHLSAIRLRAVGCRGLLDGAEQAADSALGTIAELSGQALDEIRHLLGLLHEPPGVATSPGLADLPRLVEQLSAGGLRITLVDDNRGWRLPARIQHCAYRIVQESLTNVVRHADFRRAEVRVTTDRRSLRLTITNDGPARPADTTPAEGNGVRGMRARAESFGGTLTAGPRFPRGWRVHASIPLPTDDQSFPDQP